MIDKMKIVVLGNLVLQLGEDVIKGFKIFHIILAIRFF